MNWYLIFKFLHVLAVIISVGGLFARQVIRQRVEKSEELGPFANYSEAASWIDRIMVIPGMSAILVLGIITGLIGGAPILGFLQGAPQNWLLASNLILVSVLVLIPTVLVPHSKHLREVLRSALEQGKFTDALKAAQNDRLMRFAHYYEEAAVVVIAALMVLKPF